MFHVLNRGVGRMRLFLKDADFEAFERIVAKTLDFKMRGFQVGIWDNQYS